MQMPIWWAGSRQAIAPLDEKRLPAVMPSTRGVSMSMIVL